MRHFSRFVLVLLTLAIPSCVRIDQDTRQDQTSPVGGNGIGPTPSANPSPNAPPVATVNVGEYTSRDGLNCGAPPQMTIGCKAFVTCTPKDASGNDLGKAYIPEWSSLGTLTFNATTLNFYNGRVECSEAGLGAVACKVGGVTGSMQLTCVAAP